MTADQLDEFAELVAVKVVEQLDERDQLASRSLVGANELAALLGRSREWVYDHAEELGGRRIGNGTRPRLWFDVDQAVSGRRSSEGSHASESPAPAGGSARRRRRAPGSGVELLPIGGRKSP